MLDGLILFSKGGFVKQNVSTMISKGEILSGASLLVLKELIS